MKLRFRAALAAVLLSATTSAAAQSTQANYYDGAGRLVGVTRAAPSQTTSTGYAYDSADNRTSLQTSTFQGSPPSGPPPAGTPGPSSPSGFTPQQQAILAACAASTPPTPSSGCTP